MDLVNEFTVKAPIDEAWNVLTDLERIAPCLPGAQLTEVEGDIYRGGVKIKVGPITAQFKGQAQFTEKDEANHKGTIKADGRDTGGKGNAAAFIHAHLTAVDATTTKCEIRTELTITGKVAQFGRGALADVSGKLIDQFARNLETMVLSDQHPAPAPVVAAPTAAPDEAGAVSSGAVSSGAVSSGAVSSGAGSSGAGSSGAGSSGAVSAPTVRKIEPRGDVQPVDLLGTAGAPLAKRLLPIGLLGLILLLLFRRRHHG